MSDIKNGGPAFPVPGLVLPSGDSIWPEQGMTLHDWYVGQALVGVLANSSGHYGRDVADALIGALARAAYERLRTQPVTMPDSAAAKQALPAQRPAA